MATLSVPYRLPMARAEGVAKLATAYFERPPKVRIRDGQVRWTDRRRLSVTLTPREDLTEVRVCSPRLIGSTLRWKEWVERAAYRVEAAIRLFASDV